MTRKECLDKAAECVLKDRQNVYGKPEDCFGMIAGMWGAYLGVCVSAHDVAAMMALLKIARFRHNPSHEDNAVDCAGYAACMVETATAWEREGKDEAEGGCCQNGNDQPEEPEFKPGDPVEWFSFGRKDAEPDGWHPAFYLCRAGDHDYHVVQDIDGMYHVVNYANIRSPEAMYKPGDKVEALSFDGSRWEDAVVERTEVLSGQWYCTVRLASGERHRLPVAGSIRRPARAGDKAESCEEPEFKYGDRVQFRDEIPSTSEPHWFEGVYVERLSTGGHAVKFGPHGHVIYCSDKDIRRVPKAEGCEALVEKDAPQTPQELYQHIVDCNPATFGRPRTPTGEELAEMAEEEGNACS